MMDILLFWLSHHPHQNMYPLKINNISPAKTPSLISLSMFLNHENQIILSEHVLPNQSSFISPRCSSKKMRPTIYHQSSIINDRQQSTIINNLHQHQHLHQQFIISILVPTATTTMVTMATMVTGDNQGDYGNNYGEFVTLKVRQGKFSHHPVI